LTLTAKVSSKSASVADWLGPSKRSAGVVDQDVDPAVDGLVGPLGEFMGGGDLGERREVVARVAGLSFGSSDHLGGPLFVAADDQHVGTACCECDGGCSPDTAGRAGSQCGLALKVCIGMVLHFSWRTGVPATDRG
jgi:hypothetical protein